MSYKTIECSVPLNMQCGTVSAGLKVPSYKFMVISLALYCSCVTSLYSNSLSVCVSCLIFLFVVRFSSSPPFCGLSDLPVNSSGCSELCLCYWKQPSKSSFSRDVQMIGCAVFGYPFSITGNDCRELPVMMTMTLLRCSQEEKPKKPQNTTKTTTQHKPQTKTLKMDRNVRQTYLAWP